MRRYQTSDANYVNRQNMNSSSQNGNGRGYVHNTNQNAQNMHLKNMNTNMPPNNISKPQPQNRQAYEQNLNEKDKKDDGILGSIFKLVPPFLYNRDTKKLFGILSAEDLLLIAFIIMLADSDDNDDTALLVALLYILIS